MASRSRFPYQAPPTRIGYQTVPRTMGVYAKGEMKYFDTEITTTNIPASADWTGTEFPPSVGTPNTMCVPTTGSAINQRIGRDVYVHKIRVRGLFTTPAQANQTAGDNPAVIRYALVQDTQTNSAQAQGEQIFQAPTTAIPAQVLCSFQSLANFGRFKVLTDRICTLQNPNMSFDATNIEVNGLAKFFKISHVFKTPQKVTFNATNGGTISDVVNNSWSIYATCFSTALTPSITYSARVYYKEGKL